MHTTDLSEKTDKKISPQKEGKKFIMSFLPVSVLFCVQLRPRCRASWLTQLRNSGLGALLVLCKDAIQTLLRFPNLSLLCFTDVHLWLDSSKYWEAVHRAFHVVRKWMWNLTNHCLSHYMHLQGAKNNLHSATVLWINSRLRKTDCS